MRKWIIAPVGLALLGVAGCGETQGQRAATGAGGGAIAGAVVGGPVGALAGAGIGAAGGAYREELQQRSDDAVDRASRNDRQPEEARTSDGGDRDAVRQQSAARGDTAGDRPWAQDGAAEAAALTNEEVREAQTALRELGFYDGRIDGLYGRRTIAAVGEFQAQQQDLPRTLALDDATRERLRNRQVPMGDADRPQDAGRAPAAERTQMPEPTREAEPTREQPSDPQQQGRLSGQQQ